MKIIIDNNNLSNNFIIWGINILNTTIKEGL
jgi:hypothetical protein